MSKKLDWALVIDVESTCWEHEPPRGQTSEIIEVGLCVVDLQLLERRERRSIMVKPMMSEVGEFCTRLTGITPEMVAQAATLPEALRILRDQFRSDERLFASWGDYDRNQFMRNCRTYDLKYPFGPTHLNVKNLFPSAFGLSCELGIDAACARLGVTMEGTHHRGVDDAWNIARILCLLLKRIRRASV
jgi:inhibitor of KinA sporulation pathway (predicted exonuclease)